MGRMFHGQLFIAELSHVPLVLHRPAPATGRSWTRWCSIDIMPTILELAESLIDIVRASLAPLVFLEAGTRWRPRPASSPDKQRRPAAVLAST